MEFDNEFWKYLNKLVSKNEIVIDRPKGTRHPKYGNIVYEIDYGYLKNTETTDNNEIDVFKGSLHNKNVNSVMCTVDLLKKDIEIKILIGCTEIEKQKIYEFLNSTEYMKAIMIEKDIDVTDVQKEIVEINNEHNFNELLEVFEDVVFAPTEENIRKILLEYEQNNEKTLYGYFLNNKIIGIIGIKTNSENNEILHFGIHPEYRGKNLGSGLMDYIKSMNKTMVLSTDEDAVIFYQKYGFICTEYHDEKRGKRYNCIFE